MKKMVKVLGLSALVGALAFGGAAVAVGPHGGPGGGHAPLKQLMKKLDLDDEQKALARELQAENQAAHAELIEQKSEIFDAVIDELENEDPDKRVIDRAIDEGTDRTAEAMKDRVDGFLELHATFSPEQRATLVDELSTMQDKRAEMFERRSERFEGEQ